MAVTRRGAIGGLLATLVGWNSPAYAMQAANTRSAPRRLVGLDRVATQLLLSAGVVPLATDVRDYLAYGAAAPLPIGVLDFGSNNEPNLELLEELKPDLLVSSLAPPELIGRVSEIAPSMFLPIFGEADSPLKQAVRATLHVGDVAGSADVAASTIADLEMTVNVARARSSSNTDKSFLLIGLEPDGRHATVYGKNSIMQDIADRIGIRNAWSGHTNEYGFTLIGIESLIGISASLILYMDEGEITDAALARLAESPFWAALPFVKEGRLARLPGFDPLGTLPSAKAFAISASTLLAHAAKGLAG